METELKTNDIPVFVDLDRTLVKTDLAQEQLAALVLRPSHYSGLIRAATQGRPQLKQYLAENVPFDAATLPYAPEVIAYLHAQKALGRKIVLATAADRSVADQIAVHLGLFDAVIASQDGQNLKGRAKLTAIEQMADGPFEYLGDSQADVPIWQAAARVGYVNPVRGAVAQIDTNTPVAIHVDTPTPPAKALFRAMRPHQWVKNTLIFLPLFFSHSYSDPQLILWALLTFVAFSLLASSVYLVNDLWDLSADRAHSEKRNRPFAAGVLSPVYGLLAVVLLASCALGLAYVALGSAITMLLLIYLAINFVYSGWLKHHATIDVIVLTCLYTLRLFMGGVAIGALPSPWLLNFSMFFFVSLALMKRHVELVTVRNRGQERSRGYHVRDLPVILAAGVSNGGLAVLTLTLYLNSDFVRDTYASPMILWLVAPLILFWIQRAWVWTLRDKIHSDPVVFALRDKVSRHTLLLTCAIVVTAKYINIGDWFL